MTSLFERLLHVARWVRVEAPLLPPAEQMPAFADAARTLEALAEQVRELENGSDDRFWHDVFDSLQ